MSFIMLQKYQSQYCQVVGGLIRKAGIKTRLDKIAGTIKLFTIAKK